ncbi:MAG: hypothetical protein WBV82_24165 [Myxococcaceae bacterium]
MDPFVRRLVERLLDPSRPLSRNRHFHTFETPEGKLALRVSRRLRALHHDLLSCREEGGAAGFVRQALEEGVHRVEIRLERVAGRRISLLHPAEFELLLALPGVSDVLTPGDLRTPRPATADSATG